MITNIFTKMSLLQTNTLQGTANLHILVFSSRDLLFSSLRNNTHVQKTYKQMRETAEEPHGSRKQSTYLGRRCLEQSLKIIHQTRGPSWNHVWCLSCGYKSACHVLRNRFRGFSWLKRILFNLDQLRELWSGMNRQESPCLFSSFRVTPPHPGHITN